MQGVRGGKNVSQGVLKCYRGLQKVTGSYTECNWLQEVTGGYKGLQEITGGYLGVQKGHKGFKEDTKGYRGLQ